MLLQVCLEEVGLPHGHRRLRALASAAGAPSLTAPAPLALERGALLILHNVGLHTWECVGLDQYGRLMTAMQTRMAATPPTTPPTIAAVLFELFEDETFGSQSVERAFEVLPSGQSAHVEAPAAEILPAWQ